MIKIKVDQYSGDTWITKGGCQLFIEGRSHRIRHACFHTLVSQERLNEYGRAEYSENRRAVMSFAALKVDILYQHFGSNQLGRFDNVNTVPVNITHDIINGSVFA